MKIFNDKIYLFLFNVFVQIYLKKNYIYFQICFNIYSNHKLQNLENLIIEKIINKKKKKLSIKSNFFNDFKVVS